MDEHAVSLRFVGRLLTAPRAAQCVAAASEGLNRNAKTEESAITSGCKHVLISRRVYHSLAIPYSPVNRCEQA